MTKKEAIDLLDNLIGFVEDNHGSDYDEALKIAIKTLEQELCEDAISRQAVINSFKNWLNDNKDPRSFEEVVKEMPSAISSQKEGLNY